MGDEHASCSTTLSTQGQPVHFPSQEGFTPAAIPTCFGWLILRIPSCFLGDFDQFRQQSDVQSHGAVVESDESYENVMMRPLNLSLFQEECPYGMSNQTTPLAPGSPGIGDGLNGSDVGLFGDLFPSTIRASIRNAHVHKHQQGL